MFEKRSDYALPLLQVFAELGTGDRQTVKERFLERWRSHVPQKDLLRRQSGSIKFDKNIDWLVQDLRDIAFIVNTQRGVWRITEEARAFLQQHAAAADRGAAELAARISAIYEEYRSKEPRGPGDKKPRHTPPVVKQPPQEKSRPLAAHAMTDQPTRRSARNSADAANHQALHAAVDQLVRQITHLLAGRAERPADEQICNWIWFCYTFELYSETAQLFDLLDQNAVAPLLYNRAREMARAARLRLRQETSNT